jgi:hypothetical protein
MHLGDPLDPAIEAASLALAQRPIGPSSRFASIELRGEARPLSQLAPLGYAAAVLLGLISVSILWFL